MKSHTRIAVAWVLALALGTRASAADIVERAKIDALARPLVDGGWVYGAALGLISEKGTQFVGYGRISEKESQPPGPDTLFEIGSITKTLTGLLLAQMAAEHQVELNDPVQKLLGDTMSVPKGDREITLVDLVTHSSGLPRLPGNIQPKDMTNPYADYTLEQLATCLAGHKLRRQPGKLSEYSNLGFGLLGHALALRSGTSYESLLRKRICEPLGMSDTRITLDEVLTTRLAQGHDSDGNPQPNWDLPTLAGAGAVRSTASDMLKFLAANVGLAKTPLAAAIAESHVVRFKVPLDANDVALAWQVKRDEGTIWHNGGTGGYHSFAGFSPEKRLGVVVLSNTSSSHVDGLGFGLLRLLMGEGVAPPKLPQAVKLEADALEPLVADYRLSPVVTVKVTREGAQLFVQLTGQPKLNFYPESKTRFFCRLVEAAVTFERDAHGKIEKLVIHQGGQNLPAPRTE